MSTIYCKKCNTETSNPKFCSLSCSVSFNNTGIRRHGKPPNLCQHCGINKTKHPSNKFCSHNCHKESYKSSPERKKAINAAAQAKYKAKKLRTPHETANKELIRQFYFNRPEGYHVDHIIPLSKGGLHHQDNLQYLTETDNLRKGNKLIGRTLYH